MRQRTVLTLALALLLLLAAGCSGREPQDSFSEDLEEGSVQLTQESAVTFSDGETADLYRWDVVDSDVYLLADGTRLLTVGDPVLMEAGDGETVAGLDSLGDQARGAITAYYEQQGALYEEEEEAARAYEEYLRCQASGETYAEDRTVWQETGVTFSNRHIICLRTTVTLPLEGETGRQLSYGAVFDAETGETVEQWELFSLSEEETRAWLAGQLAGDDAALGETLASALAPEHIFLFPDRLEVQVPAGALADRETEYRVVIAYDDEVLSRLEEWARPEE